MNKCVMTTEELNTTAINLEYQLDFFTDLTLPMSKPALYEKGGTNFIEGPLFIEKGMLPLNLSAPLPDETYNIVNERKVRVASIKKGKKHIYSTRPVITKRTFEFLQCLLTMASYDLNPHRELYYEDYLGISAHLQVGNAKQEYHTEDMSYMLNDFLGYHNMDERLKRRVMKLSMEIFETFKEIIYTQPSYVYDLNYISRTMMVVTGISDIRVYRYMLACEIKDIKEKEAENNENN